MLKQVQHNRKKLMLQKLFYIFFLLLNICCLYSQTEYEYWGDDYFNRDSTNEFELILKQKISAGFFPLLSTPSKFYWITESNGWDYSVGSFFINDIYPRNTEQFFAQISNNDLLKKMKEKKSFSDDKKYGWFSNDKSRQNFNAGLRFDIPLNKLYTTISTNVGVMTRYITAYSTVREGEYVDPTGTKKKLEQISFAEINDQHIYFDLNLKHPLYGFSIANVYKSKTTVEIEMFYYLLYGIGASYSYLDKMNVYEYILSDQDAIRFTNGEIRSPSVFKKDFDRVHRLRYHYIIGLGWQFGGNNWAGNFELIYKNSLQPPIADSDYKHNVLLLRTGISITFLRDVIMFYKNLFF